MRTYMSCQTAALLITALFELERYTQLTVMHIVVSSASKSENTLQTGTNTVLSYSQKVRKYSPGINEKETE